MSELQHDRKLRAWTHDENKKIGLTKYKVVDLRIVENPNPKAFDKKMMEEKGNEKITEINGESLDHVQ